MFDFRTPRTARITLSNEEPSEHFCFEPRSDTLRISYGFACNKGRCKIAYGTSTA
jgi:hypothetical protein